MTSGLRLCRGPPIKRRSQSLLEEISIGATGLGWGRGVRRQQRWSGAVFWEWEHGVESCCGHP
eukprot:15444087-Alexandrium_andersonii.AAC.1